MQVPELDPAALGGLMEMGFPEALCRNALLWGRNRFEPALEWLLSHAEDPAAAEPLRWAGPAAAAGLRPRASCGLAGLLACSAARPAGSRCVAAGRRRGALCMKCAVPQRPGARACMHGLPLQPGCSPPPAVAPPPLRSDAQLARLYGRGPPRQAPAVDEGSLAHLTDMGFDRAQASRQGRQGRQAQHRSHTHAPGRRLVPCVGAQCIGCTDCPAARGRVRLLARVP